MVMASASLWRVGGFFMGTILSSERKEGWNSSTRYAERFFQIGSSCTRGVREYFWIIEMAWVKDMQSDKEAWR